MRQRVADLRHGRRSIGEITDDLSALMWELTETPQAWCDRFIEEWSVLEISYAVALDRGSALPTAADVDIAEALDNLDRLVEERSPSP